MAPSSSTGSRTRWSRTARPARRRRRDDRAGTGREVPDARRGLPGRSRRLAGTDSADTPHAGGLRSQPRRARPATRSAACRVPSPRHTGQHRVDAGEERGGGDGHDARERDARGVSRPARGRDGGGPAARSGLGCGRRLSMTEPAKLSPAARRRWDLACDRIRDVLVDVAVAEGMDARLFDRFAATALQVLANDYRRAADTAGAIRTDADHRAHTAAVEEAACDTADA